MSDVHDDYVAGDINTFDEDVDEMNRVNGENDVNDVNEHNDGFGNAERAVTASAALTFIAKSLAEDPSAVSVEVSERHDKVVLSLSVGPNLQPLRLPGPREPRSRPPAPGGAWCCRTGDGNARLGRR